MTSDVNDFRARSASSRAAARSGRRLRGVALALASVSALALGACGNVGGIRAAKMAYGEGDYAKARSFFENVSYDADAKYYLGRIYRRGEGVDVDYGKAAQYFEAASLEDHPRAKVELAALYEAGRGVARDPVKAVRLYEEAIGAGRDDAKVDLGMLYKRGAEGIEPDPERAARLFREAAADPEPSRTRGEAAYQLAELTLAGKGVEKDPQAAVALYEASLEDGFEKAGVRLGDLYRRGKQVEADPIASARYYRAAAELTDGYNGAKARHLLGVMFIEGNGVPRDAAEGSDLLQQAAQRGYVRAAVDLGRYYEEGEFLPRDPHMAQEWYRDAIEMDDGRRGAQAEYYLARLLLETADDEQEEAEEVARGEAAPMPPEATDAGDETAATTATTGDGGAEEAVLAEDAASATEALEAGEEAEALAAETGETLPAATGAEALDPQLQEGQEMVAEADLFSPDPETNPTQVQEAVALLEDAAGRDYSAASLFLGRLYANGDHVKRDYSRAADWFQKTINDDDGRNGARARYYLAQMYLTATGVAQDTDRAVRLLEESITAGYFRSAELLGELYNDGSFIDRDPVLAFAYLTSAVRGGRNRAETSRQRLESELDPEQRAKAEELAQSFYDGG